MHFLQNDDAGILAFAIEIYPAILQTDFLRYFIGTGVVWGGCEHALNFWTRNRKIRQQKPAAAQLFREFAISMRTVALFSLVGLGLAIAVKTGWLSILPYPQGAGWVWFAINLALLLVLHDAWFYWSHKIMHNPALYRHFHRVHHRSFNPSPFAAYAFNIGETAVNAAFYPIVLLIVPTSGLCAVVFLFIMMGVNALHHSGYEIYPARADGKPLFDWMTSVTHHDLHHAEARWNFGFYFTFWDRFMGTEHPRYHEEFAKAVQQTQRLATTG